MSHRSSRDEVKKGFGFGGFSIKSKGTGPESQMAQLGMGAPGMPQIGMAGRHLLGPHLGKKRVKSEEEYFEDEDREIAAEDLEYQPAPGSPSYKEGKQSGSDSDESVDALDQFMSGIQEEVHVQALKDQGIVPAKKEQEQKGVRDDIENEDVEEGYYRYMEENPMAGVLLDDDNEIIEYDEDGNAIIPTHRKVIDPLPPIDHDDFDYEKFNKNFYEEHEEIKILTNNQVEELRDKLGIKVSGIDLLKPVSSFGHFGFDEKMMKNIMKAEYTQPMPIQAQGIPVALSGRDIIGIAKTGSGKTAAFIWPMIVHIMDQRELKKGEGPIGLICAPTRELSQQIYHEAKKFGKAYNIKVVCAYGGGSMYEQAKACEEGAEIIVCTPGRLIDLVKKKDTNLQRVTFLVFDEADRMFDMGFEPQVRSIADHVRPNRQTLLFSATFKKRIERLARDILTDPIRVVQGDIGEANEDVTQVVKVVPPGPHKWTWLTGRLVQLTTTGSVLIFVTKKANSEELAVNLRARDFKVGLMHGDMSQSERNEVINSFKKKEVPILVATDVAARGLDIPHIKTVVNFDVARDIDTHTHRVGRTGRAGTKGTAFTLLTEKDKEFAPHLVRNLEGANQRVPEELLEIANKCPWFKTNRYKKEKAKKLNIGGRGLGFKERPGLGASSSTKKKSSDPTSFAEYEPSQSSGPQANRLHAMRAAFSAQFRSNFVSAQDEETKWQGSTGTKTYGVFGPRNQETEEDDSEAPKRKRKSRWDDS